MKNRYLVICDYREKFLSYFNDGTVYNDHFKKENIDNIIRTLINLGYDCEYFGGVYELITAIQKNETFDNCIFLNFNDGLTHEHKRGQTPILLEMLTNKFSGSNAFSALLASDKYCTNNFIRALGIVKSPKSVLYLGQKNLDGLVSYINFPIIVKPNNEGSSLGINETSICHNIKELEEQIAFLANKFDKLIIEEYIQGFEFTVFLVGNETFAINQPLGVGITDKYYMETEVFDAEIKRNHKRKFCAPENLIPYCKIEELKNISSNIFKCLNFRDYARLDFRYYNGEFYFIEANTVPAISLSTDVGQVCKILNITFDKFIEIILETINRRLKINNALN